VCQYLTLLRRLPAEVLAAVEVERDPAKLKAFTLRRLLTASKTKGMLVPRRLPLRTSTER
jgi:hypothetical protein